MDLLFLISSLRHPELHCPTLQVTVNEDYLSDYGDVTRGNHANFAFPVAVIADQRSAPKNEVGH